MTQHNSVTRYTKVGAILFAIWSILHIWVGFEGIHQYLNTGAHGLWDLVTGGKNAPHGVFQHSQDTLTANAHAQLLLNFCIDVGGYGVLGMVVSWFIWSQASWTAYLVGVFIIGIADLTFLFALVLPGIIELNISSVSGPIIWFLACLITPFGLVPLKKATS